MDILTLPFMQHALLAALLASIACGLIGSLVVVNRLSFLAGGIAHAAYGGVGLAFFLGLPVMPSTIAFALATSALMAAITYKRSERSDTVVGVLWAGGMALGIILLDLTPGYNVDLMSYLFGSILAVSVNDLLLMVALNTILLAVVYLFYHQFLALSFDRDYARTRGISTRFLHFLLLALIAVTVVMIIRVIGLILVIALLTIPASMAETRTCTLARMMLKATLWSLFFCLGGLLLAYQFNLTSGASIIAVAVISYFTRLLFNRRNHA